MPVLGHSLIVEYHSDNSRVPHSKVYSRGFFHCLALSESECSQILPSVVFVAVLAERSKYRGAGTGRHRIETFDYRLVTSCQRDSTGIWLVRGFRN